MSSKKRKRRKSFYALSSQYYTPPENLEELRLEAEVQAFLNSIMCPALEKKIKSFNKISEKNSSNTTDIMIYVSSSGITYIVNDLDSKYFFKKAQIFRFYALKDCSKVYELIKQLSSNYSLTAIELNYNGIDCLSLTRI